MTASAEEKTIDFEKVRANMIEQQIRPWDVLDQRVLNTIAGTPREDFVPPEYRSTLAFSDFSIPLAHGEFMLPPRLEGRILQALQLSDADRVLEIGTGSGYMTACLARLAGEVVSLDLHQDFLDAAAVKLEAHGIANVRLHQEDAAAGCSEHLGFDAIAVTGSLPALHRGFHRALKLGGRLFVVVGEPPIMEALLITRVAEDKWATESLFDTSVPPLRNQSTAPVFAF